MKWSKALKGFLISAVVMLSGFIATSQGLKHWFSQKSTQTEYLLQQISALKIYGHYLQRGYNLVQEGLHTISVIKGGHFKLDQIFIDSLKVVSGAVKRDSRIHDAIRLQRQTMSFMNATLKMARDNDYFHRKELEYFQKVFANAANGSDQLINELMKVLQDGVYQMSDDERVKRMDKIYREIKERLAFVQHFGVEISKLELQREKEMQNVKLLDKLY